MAGWFPQTNTTNAVGPKLLANNKDALFRDLSRSSFDFPSLQFSLLNFIAIVIAIQISEDIESVVVVSVKMA